MDYEVGRLEARTKLVQPPSITVDPPTFVFKPEGVRNLAGIRGKLTIEGGDQFEDAGDRVVVHNQDGPSAPGQLITRSARRMSQTGEDRYGNLVFTQDRDADTGELLYDTYRSLEGLGQPTGRIGKDTLPIYGVLLDGIESLDIRLAAGDDQFTFKTTTVDVQRVLQPVKSILVTGAGNDRVNIEEATGDITVYGGAGDDTVEVYDGNRLDKITARITFDGDGDIREQNLPVSAAPYATVIANSSSVFINSENQSFRFTDGSGNSTTYALPTMGKILLNNAGNVDLRAVVLNPNGTVKENLVQENGVQKYGVQKRQGVSGPLLWFDKDGGETADSATGIPVIVGDRTTPGALPVYLNSKGYEVFTIESPVIGGGTGLFAEYWNNKDYTGSGLVRVDPTINFDYGNGGPAASIDGGDFSARWTGYIQAPASGTYRFYTKSDDGVRLTVGGQILIDKLIDQGATEYSNTKFLNQGELYPIDIFFYDQGERPICSCLGPRPEASRQLFQ